MKFQIADGGLTKSGLVESRDCTVRALSLVTGCGYELAHAELQKAGRKRGKKFSFRRWAYSGRQFSGYQVELIVVPRPVSLGKLNLGPGRFVARKPGHVFAILDDVIHDKVVLSGRCRVTDLWKFTKI